MDVSDDGVSLVAVRCLLAPARGIHGHLVQAELPEPPTLGQVDTAVRLLDRSYHADDYDTALRLAAAATGGPSTRPPHPRPSVRCGPCQ